MRFLSNDVKQMFERCDWRSVDELSEYSDTNRIHQYFLRRLRIADFRNVVYSVLIKELFLF